MDTSSPAGITFVYAPTPPLTLAEHLLLDKHDPWQRAKNKQEGKERLKQERKSAAANSAFSPSSSCLSWDYFVSFFRISSAMASAESQYEKGSRARGWDREDAQNLDSDDVDPDLQTARRQAALHLSNVLGSTNPSCSTVMWFENPRTVPGKPAEPNRAKTVWEKLQEACGKLLAWCTERWHG